MTYVDLDPDEHRPVQVHLGDGLSCDGYLESYRQVEGVVVALRALLDRAGGQLPRMV